MLYPKITIECVACAGGGKRKHASGSTEDCELCGGGGTIEVALVPHNDAISLRQARPNLCRTWSNGDHIVAPDGRCRCGRRFIIVEVIQ